MGTQIYVMGMCILVYFLSLNLVLVSSSSVLGRKNEKGTVYIDGRNAIGKIDEDFICATLDWWPPEKCDYGTCAWDHASLLNLDLSNQIFLKAIQAFSPLKIRLGGTLQDKVIYESKDSKLPCNQFSNRSTEMFGFTPGCLPMKRWDELNAFFEKAGALIVFGLNALAGRTIQSDGSATGAWDPSNAKSLVRYTVEKGYDIHGWELGNELSGSGVGTRVSAAQYASDLISLKNMLEEVYKANKSKPLVIAPGGFFDPNWFTEFINKTHNNLDVMTHHIYNLGPGVDTHLIDKILNPSYLDGEADTFRRLQNILRSSGTSAVSWVGEAGGAYNSGHNHVTNAFVFSFWYLDQLGMSSTFDTKTYCRQTLIGGNYGLLNTTTFVPNPDYYSALLWHRLMGRNVLSTSFSGTKKIRTYAHCSKVSQGIMLLLLNLDGNTTVEVNVGFNGTWSLLNKHPHIHKNRAIKWHQKEETERVRAEYHLTAKDGNLQSQTMLLNGEVLGVSSSGEIPSLTPLHVNSSELIVVGPFSIVFVHMPYIILPACK
ncbi:heparanase-like protein 3 [Chenopodium quinoa]|uniref:heparanase-like protein 3 n=1 Tax=Chenopodium quinoa TaxID=63459 RepID=UPI000B79AE97|nr:heparanase-like protein 3 [Chenopodium quinoa]